MNIAGLIKRRLEELGCEQKDLAAAAQVTESYISQLLTGKKSLPAHNRSDIYGKIGAFLKLSPGELAKLAEVQRREELTSESKEPAQPFSQEVRELILRKCKSEKAKQLRLIFEKEPFGEIERLITQKLLGVAKGVAKEEWKNEAWLRVVARLNHRSYEEVQATVLEFLETDIFSLSVQTFVYFLNPLIESWYIALLTFGMKIVLAPELGRERMKQFEFVERELEPVAAEEPGLGEFLQNASLSG